MSDVAKKFFNEIKLSGELMELEDIIEKEDKNGKHYMSVKGSIKCGESNSLIRNFECFLYEVTKSGKENSLYKKAMTFFKNAVPATADPDNPTKVQMIGNLGDNTYVNSSDELKSGFRYSVSIFNEFKEYQCEINIEGYVSNYVPETDKDGVETNNYKMTLLTSDFSKNNFYINNIIVPEDMVEITENAGYEEGKYGVVYLSYVPVIIEEESDGFGKQQVTGKSYSQLTLVGGKCAQEVLEEDGNEKVLDVDMVKEMKKAAKQRIEDIKSEGYLGSKTSNTKASSKTSSSKTSSKKKTSKVEEEEDEDLPF